MPLKKQRLSYGKFLSGRFKVIRTPFFSLKIIPNNLAHHRIGVVISVAVVPLAVKRNFWRRQIKSALSAFSGPSRDMIVIVNKPITSLTKSAFKKEVQKLSF